MNILENMTSTALFEFGGRIRSGSGIIEEDSLDRRLEDPRQPESERQAGIVLAGLNGIDRLARYTQHLRKLRLRPPPLRPQYSDAIIH